MKTVLKVFIVSILFCSCDNSEKNSLSIIKSNTETIKYSIDGKYYPNWKISPELKPDRLNVECGKKSMKVGFITDVDSIFFSIKEKDTIRFHLLFKQKDTALTEIVGIPKNVHFSDKYISHHKGKFAVKIPEVHELANIMVAISKIGQIDSNMVDLTTKYHKDVISHFSPYINHPAIDTLNNYITEVLDNESYYYYYSLKMNSCGYLFNNKNKIIDDGIIHRMGFSRPEDPFKQHSKLFEDFAKQSNFREFYKNHTPYYTNLISTYKELNPIKKMQNWLEKKFNFKYGNYLVTFSPLVGGAHSTQKFEDNGFKQTVMFVCRSEFSTKYNRNVDEMLNSRVVFTEIDHNFVNPTSDKYLEKINDAFKVRKIWAEDAPSTNSYGSSYAVFNEYMTFALFSIYCLDNFPIENVHIFIPKMEKLMVEHRGFINFNKFNQKMINVFQKSPKTTIDELYIIMLEWSSKQ